MKTYANIALVLILPTLTLSSVASDDVELYYSYYKDDKRLEVESPSVILNKSIRDNIDVALKYVHETFTKTAPDNAVDAVSGATTVAGGTGSGFKETRKEGAVSGAYRMGDHEFAAGLVRGDEEDYESTSYSVAYSRELYQKNVTASVLYGFTTDDVYAYSGTGAKVAGFPKHKDTHAVTASISQIISPTQMVTGGYSFATVDGYQSNPLRKVAVNRPIPGGSVQTIYDESHPNSRDRHTLFVRGTQYFDSRSSLDLNIALYSDSWGVQAHSIEARAYHYLTSNLVGRVRYRAYSQDQSDFYKPAYTQQESIMTADTRLRAFDSKLYGLQLTYYPRATLKDISFTGTYDKFDETNAGLSADVYQVSVVIPY